MDITNQSEIVKASWFVAFASWLTSIWNWFTNHGSETIVIISGLLGIVLLSVSIAVKRKESKLKDLELKIKQKELDILDNEDN